MTDSAASNRIPTPLYLADIHLHRARIFHARDESAKAGSLIARHHEELADAEAAAKSWSDSQ